MVQKFATNVPLGEGRLKVGEKPNVLIIGGLGYIGRYLAKYIYDNGLADNLRIVDKQLPELAWLAPEFKDACSRTKYVQADAGAERFVKQMFDLPENSDKTEPADREARGFDYVFNCAEPLIHRNYHVPEDQRDDLFLQQAKSVTELLAKQCARRRIPVYVELSTGNVYKSSAKKPATEADGKMKPQTRQAKWKLEIEEQLRKLCSIPDDKVDPEMGRLDACVLRLANVYGPYVTKFLGQALCLARVYQAEEKEMRWLWGEDMRTDTVHVEDAVEAMWAAAEWLFKTSRSKREVLPIFNIVDGGKTTQGDVAGVIREIFQIENAFQGTIVSQFAKLNMSSVVDDLNEETLDTWGDLRNEAKTSENAPLGPYMDKETLRDDDLALDGSSFAEAVGFKYKHPKLTKSEVEAVIASYKTMNWWP